jgi:arginine utilization protein RocB
MLDMKSGLAAGIAVLERFASNPGRQGNLILLATPDEERESRGMRSLRDDLPGLVQENGLEIEAAINMDVTSDQGDGSEGRAIYEGSIGKLLPFAFVIGQSSHAAYPFEGISAQMIGAGIVQAIEGNVNLADTGSGDVSPPPICLEARDLRQGYEVTTPERSCLSFNWLYHSGSPADRFELFCNEVHGALDRAIEQFGHQAKAFAAKTGTAPGAALATPRVITVAELKALVLKTSKLQDEFSAVEQGLASIDNPLTVSRACTEWLVDAAQIKGPAVVVGFSGLHYPPCRLDRSNSRDAQLVRAIEIAKNRLAGDSGMSVRWRPHFQGISDMSFLGQPQQEGSHIISENTPATRLVDKPNGQPLAFPVVNIGPWGRELHQRLERVYAPYAFESLPRLLAEIAHEFLGGSDNDTVGNSENKDFSS